jgi:HAD superfamily hydrolase (TIGR01490 family)
MPDLAARRAKSKSAAPYAAPVCLYKVTRMKKNIAFFDFDGTITHEDTFTPFIYQSLDAKAIRQGKLRLLPYILAWKMGWLSASAIRQKVFHYAFAGKSQPEILQRGNDHSQVFIPHTLRENAMQRIAWHQARGDTVVVVSASLDVYLRPWCQQHNLELLCSEVEFQNGAATGKYQGETAAAWQARILANYSLADYEEIFAYGDTPEDFAMLALATTQIYRWDEAPP